MNKRILLLLFTFVLIGGCGKKEAPPLPIGEEELIQTMADVHLAEAALQNLYGEEKDSIAQLYYQQIFFIHDIEKENFEESMNILRRHPETAERIYSLVMEELSKREANAE